MLMIKLTCLCWLVVNEAVVRLHLQNTHCRTVNGHMLDA